MSSNHAVLQEILLDSIVEITVEAWRFGKLFEKVLQKLDVFEQKKYISQYKWFFKKVYIALENAGLRIVNVEGEYYDVGMAVTPLNLNDFASEDSLVIEQMLEPIIMDATSVIKTGTVILKLGRARCD